MAILHARGALTDTAPDRDRGDIVMGWLVKLTATFAILGVIAFDGISMVTTRLTLEDQGDTAARAASETWNSTHDVHAALASATTSLTESNALNTIDEKTFRIEPDGTTEFTVHREAATLVAHHVGALKTLYDASAQAQGKSTA